MDPSMERVSASNVTRRNALYDSLAFWVLLSELKFFFVGRIHLEERFCLFRLDSESGMIELHGDLLLRFISEKYP